MKTIILFIALSLNIFAQSNLIILMSSDPTVTPPSSGHYTTGLQYYGNIDSLSNGDVASWADEITGMAVVINGGDSTYRPIKSGNDVFFLTGDWLLADSTSISFNASPISIEIILEVTDSATTDIFTARGTDFLSFSFHGGRFCAYAYDGTTEYWYNGWALQFMGRHHIIATWDGSSAPIVYLDGEVAPAIDSPYLGLAGGDNKIQLVGTGAHQTISIPLWRVYNIELTPTQVLQNLNSTSVQDLMP